MAASVIELDARLPCRIGFWRMLPVSLERRGLWEKQIRYPRHAATYSVQVRILARVSILPERRVLPNPGDRWAFAPAGCPVHSEPTGEATLSDVGNYETNDAPPVEDPSLGSG